METVAPDVVGAGRVDGDDQNVPMGSLAAGEEEQGGEGKGYESVSALGHERAPFILEPFIFGYTYLKSPRPSAATNTSYRMGER
jgi:hypothetical protein